MKFTALAFLTVAFCVSVQANGSLLNKRDKHHIYGCPDVAEKLTNELRGFKKNLNHAIDKSPFKEHKDEAKKVEHHAEDITYRVREWVGAQCKIPENEFLLREAKALCAVIENDAETLAQRNIANPIFKSAADVVRAQCAML